MSSVNTIFFSLLGGVIPALIWLWFWLKEDRLQPEPKSKIALSFIFGMVAVWPSLFLEKYACSLIDPAVCSEGKIVPGLLLILFWAVIEETIKYVFAFFSSFWKNSDNDEPIDAIIYMITVALGFSAMENTLFLLKLVGNGLLIQSIMTGNSRFLGATLLHVASSATIGVMMGLAFFKNSKIKKILLLTGIALSVLLHTIFNLLIIKFDNGLFFVFSGIWVLIIILMVFFEKVKKVKN